MIPYVAHIGGKPMMETINGPKLNKAVIPHHTCISIPIHILKQQVSINEKYLKEKSYKCQLKIPHFCAFKIPQFCLI